MITYMGTEDKLYTILQDYFMEAEYRNLNF